VATEDFQKVEGVGEKLMLAYVTIFLLFSHYCSKKTKDCVAYSSLNLLAILCTVNFRLDVHVLGNRSVLVV